MGKKKKQPIVSEASNKIIHLESYIKRKRGDTVEEGKKKLEKFEPGMVRDLYDTLTNHNWALRAFGALLESADLGTHFDNHEKSAEYRWGLNQIVELYINYQERKLEDIWAKSINCPEDIIKGSLLTYEFVQQGGPRSREVGLEEVRKALNKINLVISEFGLDEYPQAGKARDNLLSLQDAILKKMVIGKGKKAGTDNK